MARATLFGFIRSQVARFRGCERGNVLMTFALTLIPLIGFVGAAVDYSRANSAKAAMQSALDSAGLMLSKDAQTLTPEALAAKADDYFLALFNRPEVTNVVLTPTLQTPVSGSFKLNLVASGKVPSTLSKIFGHDN